MNFHATVVGGIKESVAFDTNQCPDFILRPAFWKALTKISYYQYLVIKPSARQKKFKVCSKGLGLWSSFCHLLSE